MLMSPVLMSLLLMSPVVGTVLLDKALMSPAFSPVPINPVT